MFHLPDAAEAALLLKNVALPAVKAASDLLDVPDDDLDGPLTFATLGECLEAELLLAAKSAAGGHDDAAVLDVEAKGERGPSEELWAEQLGLDEEAVDPDLGHEGLVALNVVPLGPGGRDAQEDPKTGTFGDVEEGTSGGNAVRDRGVDRAPVHLLRHVLLVDLDGRKDVGESAMAGHLDRV